MQVALITVGDELLAGDTENTNATWLATRLTERGTRVERVVVVPDETDAISAEVARLSAAYDAVLATGGIGPTHDDVTMDGVADAFGRELAEHPDAVEYFEAHGRYEFADLTEGTTHLPAGARLLENTEGVAPGPSSRTSTSSRASPWRCRRCSTPSQTSSAGRERTSSSSPSMRRRVRCCRPSRSYATATTSPSGATRATMCA